MSPSEERTIVVQFTKNAIVILCLLILHCASALPMHERAHCLQLTMRVSGIQRGGISSGLRSTLHVYANTKVRDICGNENVTMDDMELCFNMRPIQPPVHAYRNEVCKSMRQWNHNPPIFRAVPGLVTLTNYIAYLRATNASGSIQVMSRKTSVLLDISGVRRASLAPQPALVVDHLESSTYDAHVRVRHDDKGRSMTAEAPAPHVDSFDATIEPNGATAHDYNCRSGGTVEGVHLYAGVPTGSGDQNFYHFFFGQLLPLAAKLRDIERAYHWCHVTWRPVVPTLWTFAAHGLQERPMWLLLQSLAQPVQSSGGTVDPPIRLQSAADTEASDAAAPPQSYEVLQRMDFWDVHSMHALRRNGQDGRAWLMAWAERAPVRQWSPSPPLPRVGPRRPVAVFQLRTDNAAAAKRKSRLNWNTNVPRQVMNMEEVATQFARAYPVYDVRVVNPSVLSLADQIATHSGASVIVFPHGAGMSHMIWATPGARIVEVVPPGEPLRSRITQSLAYAFGLCVERMLVTANAANITLPDVARALLRATPVNGSATWIGDRSTACTDPWSDTTGCAGDYATLDKAREDRASPAGFRLLRDSAAAKSRCIPLFTSWH